MRKSISLSIKLIQYLQGMIATTLIIMEMEVVAGFTSVVIALAAETLTEAAN